MMNRVSIIFCAVSLIITAVVLGAGCNLAAMQRMIMDGMEAGLPLEEAVAQGAAHHQQMVRQGNFNCG
ncbi:hypothetical protein [Sulfuricella sp.]|uniref:hypothetical protein n=1 Tax=Sulfuricella sp. TaxID=2099377 RepID=UPI002C31E142|nr:hypothetical protein [Sulfuricella sp.]HUX62265.1 hypothetical protein [Sulfuricella sp.]